MRAITADPFVPRSPVPTTRYLKAILRGVNTSWIEDHDLDEAWLVSYTERLLDHGYTPSACSVPSGRATRFPTRLTSAARLDRGRRSAGRAGRCAATCREPQLSGP
jgi:hypothetical protein